MTRTEKIRKLGNSIRAYRGMYHPVSKKWIHPSKKMNEWQLRLCIERLQLPTLETVKRIDAFTSFDEMRKWLAGL